MMMAPKIISTTDTNLTVMVMTWMGLVLEMLLNEKSAPERKNSVSQNSNVYSMSTAVNNFERVFPVIMHFDIETPSKYTDIARAGNIFHRSP